MFRSLVLMTAGALAAPAQAADPAALLLALERANVSHGAEVWDVDVAPCQLRLTRRTPVDVTAQLSWEVVAHLDQVDLSVARITPGNRDRLTAPWLAGRGDALDSDLWRAHGAELARRAEAAEGLDETYRAQAIESAFRVLSDRVAAGDFGTHAQRNTLHVHLSERSDGLGRLVHFWIFHPFVLDVLPGTAPDVLKALADWRAQTCAGG